MCWNTFLVAALTIAASNFTRTVYDNIIYLSITVHSRKRLNRPMRFLSAQSSQWEVRKVVHPTTSGCSQSERIVHLSNLKDLPKTFGISRTWNKTQSAPSQARLVHKVLNCGQKINDELMEKSLLRDQRNVVINFIWLYSHNWQKIAQYSYFIRQMSCVIWSTQI